MLPIVLNPDSLRIGLAGAGEGFRRRLSMLAQAGVGAPTLFEASLPSAKELAGLHILFVAGLALYEARGLALAARESGVLVNVEDRPELCDFHVPASIRRGDLLLTVSTGGRSPGAARLLREQLESQFGPEWEARLEDIAAARDAWRASGLPPNEVAERTGTLARDKGWRL